MGKTLKSKTACEAKWMNISQQLLPQMDVFGFQEGIHTGRTWNHQSSWTPSHKSNA